MNFYIASLDEQWGIKDISRQQMDASSSHQEREWFNQKSHHVTYHQKTTIDIPFQASSLKCLDSSLCFIFKGKKKKPVCVKPFKI